MQKIISFLKSKLFIVIVSQVLILFFFEALFHAFSKALFISVLIYISLYLILLAVFKKTKWATLFQSILFFIVYLISMLKIEFMTEPFFLSDIGFLSDLSDVFSFTKHSSSTDVFSVLFECLFLLIIYGLIFYVGSRYSICIKLFKTRVLFFGIGLTFLLLLFLPIQPISNFIKRSFYSTNTRKDYKTTFSHMQYYYTFGHLGGIYGSHIESFIFKNKDCDEKLINRTLKQSAVEEDNSLGKPNIIIVFSESFWDVDKLDEVTFDRPVTKNLSNLKNEGLYFEMITPSYGGNSSNIEFEFLTGGSLNYFGKAYNPYMNLYRSKKAIHSPTIISELKQNDYYTKIVPYTSDQLYNCGHVYDLFGFDDALFIPYVDSKYLKGGFASDKHVTDRIIYEMENKKTNQKMFYMTITMQNHMPYYKDKYSLYDIHITQSDLSDEDNAELLSYAQGVYDADKQLGRLYQFIKTYEEPTIIVFFGDHLPYLNVFSKLQYFHTDDDMQNVFRKYNTQSLVLANFNIDSLIQDNQTNQNFIGYDILSSYILNHMDISLSDYYRWLYSTRSIIGASNQFVSSDNMGKLYRTNQLPSSMNDLYHLRENIQYMKFVEEK